MEQNYTEKQLIRFIYGECEVLEKLEIEYALEEDLALYGVYRNFYDSYKKLPKVKFHPKRNVVNNILAYSASTDPISA
jgi:hypothetical protein